MPDRRRRPVRAAARVARRGAPGLPGGAASRRGSRAGARPRSARCGRSGVPSPSKGALDGPSGSVPSSASRSAGSATSSPSRPANRERPRWTASADSIEPMKPMNEAATNASSTTGQRRLSGWRAPTSASARSAASRADGLGVEPARVAAHADAEAGHQVGALAGERRGVGPGLRGAVGGREAARVRERHRALRVRVDGVLDLRDARRGARAARSTASASSTTRSVDQSANSAEARPFTSDVPTSSGRPVVLVLVGHLGGLARRGGRSPPRPPPRGRCRRRSPSARPRRRARRCRARRRR